MSHGWNENESEMKIWDWDIVNKPTIQFNDWCGDKRDNIRQVRQERQERTNDKWQMNWLNYYYLKADLGS